MAKKLTLKRVQAVRCPICAAGPGEKCELSTRAASYRGASWPTLDCSRFSEENPSVIEIEKDCELETQDDLLPVVDAETPQFRLW